MAATDFLEQLRGLGFEPSDIGSGRIVVPYVVESGKFAGHPIRLGFTVADDYSLNPPGTLHVSPHLLPLHPSSDLGHPAGGVHANQSFDSTFQYWSRPLQHWQQSQRSARV